MQCTGFHIQFQYSDYCSAQTWLLLLFAVQLIAAASLFTPLTVVVLDAELEYEKHSQLYFLEHEAPKTNNPIIAKE